MWSGKKISLSLLTFLTSARNIPKRWSISVKHGIATRERRDLDIGFGNGETFGRCEQEMDFGI